MSLQFHDRREAGRQLAVHLRHLAGREHVVVLALPPGGVPVGWEVAEAIDVPLDVFVVRRLGVPGHPVLTMGAITTGGVLVLNRGPLDLLRIPEGAVASVIADEREQLERLERTYRPGPPFPALAGATVVLVDDGVATSATMAAAIQAIRQMGPAGIIAAAPVMEPSARSALVRVADACVCLDAPERFHGLGTWYRNFAPVSDAEVRMLLRTAANRMTGVGAGGSHEDGWRAYQC